MAELALYRRLRPMRFADVIGQDAACRALKNQVTAGTPAHAYLFSGPRGTGKTSTARILARAVNCLQPVDGEACGACANCQAMADESLPDILEIDAASNNGVDEIRQLRDTIRYAPLQLKYKVYIIDEVHMLSPGAFNALLKTLEEPPAHAIIMMATTELHRLPATIISRCQRYEMKRLSHALLMQGVQNAIATLGGQIEPQAAALLAGAADGAMRDALSLAEQAYICSGPAVTAAAVAEMLGGADPAQYLAWAGALIDRQLGEALQLLDNLVMAGRDCAVLTADLAEQFRRLLVAGALPDPSALLEDAGEQTAQYQKLAARTTPGFLCAGLDCLLAAEAQMRWHPQPRRVLEYALARICTDPTQQVAPQDPSFVRLAERLAVLEQRLSGMAPPADPPAMAPQRPESSLHAPTPQPAPPADDGLFGPPPAPSFTPPAPQASRFDPPTTPAPAAPAAPANVQPDNGTNIAVDLAGWRQLLEHVHSQAPLLYAMLAAGQFVKSAGNTITIRFDKQPDYLLQPHNHQQLQQLVSQGLGRPVQLAFVTRDQAPPADTATVQRVMDLFGADHVVVKGSQED